MILAEWIGTSVMCLNLPTVTLIISKERRTCRTKPWRSSVISSATERLARINRTEVISLLRNDDIYTYISTSYDLLVSKEDYLHNIPGTLVELAEGDRA